VGSACFFGSDTVIFANSRGTSSRAAGGRAMLGAGAGQKSSSRKSSMTKGSPLPAAVWEGCGRRRGSVVVEAAATDDEDESRASVSRSSGHPLNLKFTADLADSKLNA
jgi:hypothetical protein